MLMLHTRISIKLIYIWYGEMQVHMTRNRKISISIDLISYNYKYFEAESITNILLSEFYRKKYIDIIIAILVVIFGTINFKTSKYQYKYQ